MDLRFSAEDEEYRAKLRKWLEENVEPPQPGAARAARAGGDPLKSAREWQCKLYEAGYVGMAWPKQYGGQDASLTEQVITTEELARAKAPGPINGVGLNILGPTLIHHGTEEQRKHFLPRMLRAEDLWCQGFSEPGAGSDLASLQTKALLDGDTFVVNGQKVWTSMGQLADWCFMLVRSDPAAPKRDGISYLLCDMKTPGITVRPLRNAAGGIHFTEVFFDDVRVPREYLVGQLHGGWKIARSSLDHERSGLSGVLGLEDGLQRLWTTASHLQRGDHAALEDPAARRQLAQHWIQVEGLRHLGYRTLSGQIAGRPPGAESSVGKLFSSIVRQEIQKTGLKLLGPLAPVAKKSPHVVDRGRWHAGYFDALGYSIGGGTSEIMRNVIAERVLGLPHSVED
jgi:alkylation response protein AidB-like acyl-CoA dehydrogenase